MPVSSALVRTPCSSPSATMVLASSRARPISVMKAPLPTLTSSTRADVPSAIFFDMIELAISGIDSTVPVTSRSAYSLRSAGASPGPAAQMTQPTRRSAAIISAGDRAARQPGMASSLSSVPPVWPRPRPDSCGTAAPHAATSGARMSETLSPTPPVECLSTVGRPTPDRSSRSPEAIIAAVQARSSPGVEAAEVDGHEQRGHLLVGDLAADVSGDQPAHLVAGQRRARPAWPGSDRPQPGRTARCRAWPPPRRQRPPPGEARPQPSRRPRIRAGPRR